MANVGTILVIILKNSLRAFAPEINGYLGTFCLETKDVRFNTRRLESVLTVGECCKHRN